jgi:hypothetical protein
MTERYPEEDLNAGVRDEYDGNDDGTIPNNVDQLRQAVVGHKIVKVHKGEDASQDESDDWWSYHHRNGLLIELDDGTQVKLFDTDDCCAYTELDTFLLHADTIDHVITGVGTTGGATTWHIYADMGDVLELSVGWSAGNPFYYGYGFNIVVIPREESNE